MSTHLRRIISEWEKHGKLIIAVDFDDTLKPYSLNDGYSINLMKRALRVIKACVDIGAHVIVLTASKEERHPEISQWCSDNGLSIYGVNKNVDGLPFGNDTKVYVNIYIDDRAGMEEALDTLEDALIHMMKAKNK